MHWSIHHVNLQAKDVRRAAAFYRDVLGLQQSTWQFPASRGYLPGDPDRLALFGDGRESHTGLHLIAPDETFAERNGLLHNPSIGGHYAIHVGDLEAVKARLRAAGVPFSETGEFAIPGLKHLYFTDPEGNLVEVNGPVGR